MLRCLALALAMTCALPALAGADDPPAVAQTDLKDGVEGLRYVDLERGAGDPLQAGDKAPVLVELWTQPGAPPVRIGTAEAPLEVAVGAGSLIRGLDLGLVGMRRGGRRYLDIPAELASGAGTPMVAVISVLDGAATTTDETPARVTPNRTVPTANAGGRTPPPAPPEVSEWDYQRNGVRIADLTVGTGDSPQRGQVVVVEYTGWVADSSVQFDSSLARAAPFEFTFGAGQVILGWEKGLRGMQVGGRRVIYIPSYLGYGSAGAGAIPAHADLIFEVELLELR